MTTHAVLFDVYGTLLRVGPPPADADALWKSLFPDFLHTDPTMSRLEFSVACSRAVARRHEAAHARGVLFPEICWPSVVAEVLPAFKQLSAAAQADFVFRQMQTGRTLMLRDGAAAALGQLKEQKRLLGVVSNSQAYSMRELDEHLATAGMNLNLFERGLSFWSFENGFSKPDPHVFRILTARLEVRGITPEEALVVGDRLDNDIEPARAQGFQTWHLTAAGTDQSQAGGFRELCAALG